MRGTRGTVRGGRGRVFDRMGPPPLAPVNTMPRTVVTPSNSVTSRTVSVYPEQAVHHDRAIHHERPVQSGRVTQPHHTRTVHPDRLIHQERKVHTSRQERIVHSPSEGGFSDRKVRQPLLNNPQKMTVTLGSQQRQSDTLGSQQRQSDTLGSQQRQSGSQHRPPGRLPYIHGLEIRDGRYYCAVCYNYFETPFLGRNHAQSTDHKDNVQYSYAMQFK